jgi:RNA polymerase sigma factor FliA
MIPVLPRRPQLHQWLPVWREYKRTGDPALRDRLIFTYAPLVKYLVYSKVKEIPARCEMSDLVSCGIEALITAIDRYDEDKGATLEQFAWTRIHGAILDELRRQDWAPRSVRRWERDIREAEDRFMVCHGRAATREELADSLGVDVTELRKRRHAISTSSITSLNSLVLTDEETPVERVELLPSEDTRSAPEEAVPLQIAKERFRDAFAALPPRDREVAVMLHVYDLTLREIGEILGVSESRVSQIHSELKRKIRDTLDQREQSQLFYELA